MFFEKRDTHPGGDRGDQEEDDCLDLHDDDDGVGELDDVC
jgi:hypothetical protein